MSAVITNSKICIIKIRSVPNATISFTSTFEYNYNYFVFHCPISDLIIILRRKFYSVCMDEETSGTLYSSSYIDGYSFANLPIESGGNRPDFRGQEFYPFPIKQAYKWDNALVHLSDLVCALY